jgi:hypothetical protein
MFPEIIYRIKTIEMPLLCRPRSLSIRRTSQESRNRMASLLKISHFSPGIQDLIAPFPFKRSSSLWMATLSLPPVPEDP